MIRLFASDLDGTLLNEYHEFDDMILNIMNRVVDEGRYFTIATGRHMHKAQLGALKFKPCGNYTICLNGALIFDTDYKPIYERKINTDALKDILVYFPDADFECIGLENVYIRISKEVHIQRLKQSPIWKRISSPAKLDAFLDDYIYNQTNEDIISQNIYKINCRLNNPQDIDKLNAYLSKNTDKFVNAPSEQGFYEITANDVNKGQAVAWLANLLQIEEDEVAVYGDSNNDLEMLKRFKHSYAMANGNEYAKALAGETIGFCKNHAVAKHILKTLQNDNSNS